MVGGISGALSRIKDAWSRAAVGASTGLGCASAIGVGLGAGAGFTWRPQPHMQAAHRTHLDPRSRGSTPAPANSRGGCPSSSALGHEEWIRRQVGSRYGPATHLSADVRATRSVAICLAAGCRAAQGADGRQKTLRVDTPHAWEEEKGPKTGLPDPKRNVIQQIGKNFAAGVGSRRRKNNSIMMGDIMLRNLAESKAEAAIANKIGDRANDHIKSAAA